MWTFMGKYRITVNECTISFVSTSSISMQLLNDAWQAFGYYMSLIISTSNRIRTFQQSDVRLHLQ